MDAEELCKEHDELDSALCVVDGSRDSVDAEELCEEHDELDSALRDHDSESARREIEEIAREFVDEGIMVDTIQAQLKEFTDKYVFPTSTPWRATIHNPD